MNDAYGEYHLPCNIGYNKYNEDKIEVREIAHWFDVPVNMLNTGEQTTSETSKQDVSYHEILQERDVEYKEFVSTVPETLTKFVNALKFPSIFLVLDLETCNTNIDNSNDIVQMAVIEYDIYTQKRKVLINEIVKPNVPIDPKAQECHKIIVPNDARNSIHLIKEINELLKQYPDNTVITGYNTDRFDLVLLSALGVNTDRFLKFDLLRVSFREYAEFRLRGWNDLTLQTVHNNTVGTEFPAHSALGDINAVIDIMEFWGDEIMDLFYSLNTPKVLQFLPFNIKRRVVDERGDWIIKDNQYVTDIEYPAGTGTEFVRHSYWLWYLNNVKDKDPDVELTAKHHLGIC